MNGCFGDHIGVVVVTGFGVDDVEFDGGYSSVIFIVVIVFNNIYFTVNR